MDERVVMMIDLDRCWGCKGCEVACKEALALGVGPRPLRVVDIGPRSLAGTSVLQRDSVPTMCQHCDEAACLAACPTGAIYRAGDGTVQIEAPRCVACGKCQEVCPFGAVDIMAGERNYAVKCTLCRERRQNGQLPSCAQHCLGRAIKVVAEAELAALVDKRYNWRTGRIVYVSDKWSGLGQALNQAR